MNSSLIKTELTKLPRPVRVKPIFAPRIMHFGPGAFFRSFVASLIDEVNEKSVEKWPKRGRAPRGPSCPWWAPLALHGGSAPLLAFCGS